MGQSLAKIYIHLIFSTKYTYPFLKDEFRGRLHSYIGGSLGKLDSPPIKINSVEDHMHILFRLSKNYSLAKIVEEVKKQSSKQIKQFNGGSKKFSWQDGYAAFSVSNSKVKTVSNYVENQKEHHTRLSFTEEVVEFIKNYDVVEYDEKYFWK